MFKKIIAFTFVTVLVAAMGFSTYWVVNNFDQVKAGLQGVQLYSHEQVIDLQEEARAEALVDEQAYIDLINQYRDTQTSLQTQLTTAVANYNDATNALLTAQNELADTNTTVSEQVAQIESLNGQIATLQSQITTLQDSLATVQAELQDTIAYYEGILETIDFTTRATATFMLDGAEYATRSIELNAVGVSVATPASTDNYDFLGWSLDGVNPVDTSTFVVTEDVTFTALLNYKYEVNFMLDGQALDPVTVYENETVSIATPQNVVYSNWDARSGYYGYDFIGWSTDGVNIVDLSSYQVTDNVTFTALLNYKAAVTFWGIFENGTFDGAGGQIRREIQLPGTFIDTSWVETYYPDALGFSLTNQPMISDISNLVITENTFIYVVFPA